MKDFYDQNVSLEQFEPQEDFCHCDISMLSITIHPSSAVLASTHSCFVLGFFFFAEQINNFLNI